jgi:hypothetical protein
VLAFQVIPGHVPDLRDKAQLETVLAACARMAELLDPAPVAGPSIEQAWGNDFDAWQRMHQRGHPEGLETYGQWLPGNGPMNYPMLLSALLVWGCGIGVLTPAIVTAAMRTVLDSPGTASGASNTARQAGGAIGVAVFGAIAGTPVHAVFAHHVSRLMWAGAAAFLLAALTCAAQARSPQHEPE